MTILHTHLVPIRCRFILRCRTDFTYVMAPSAGNRPWHDNIYSFFKSPINKISLEIGLRNVSCILLLPILNLMHCTIPFLSDFVPTTRAIGQLLHGCCTSLGSTMSPTWFYFISAFLGGYPKILMPFGPNSFTICCTHLQRFQVNKFRYLNLSRRWHDNILNKLEDKAKGLVTSLMVSTLSGLEFTTVYASVISIWRDSSSKLLPWAINNADKIGLADLICHSHTPPIWLDAGGFLSQII